MKNLGKILAMTAIGVMTLTTGSVITQAAVVGTNTQSLSITEKKSLKGLDKIKTQISGLGNIDLGKLDKVNVSTVDDIRVILENSNIDIDIDIDLINININKK